MALIKAVSNNDIGNGALIRLKQEPNIAQLDPPKTPVENLVAEILPDLRRANLRKYPWNFAIKRKIITSDVATPEFGPETKQFTFPPDFLRYLNRYDSNGDFVTEYKSNYQIEQGKLLLRDDNQDSVNVRYIFDCDKVALWDPLFVELMKLELARAIAPNFAGGKGWSQSLKQDLLEIQTQARAIDGQERPPTHIVRSAWVNSRRGRRGRDHTRVNFR